MCLLFTFSNRLRFWGSPVAIDFLSRHYAFVNRSIIVVKSFFMDKVWQSKWARLSCNFGDIIALRVLIVTLHERLPRIVSLVSFKILIIK